MLMDEWVDGWVGEGSSCVNTDVLEALQHSMAACTLCKHEQQCRHSHKPML